ncbi:uncharacterized protein K460DRAFT_273514 [Cucurbitaria berberidis CBS 394.84]|uniref:Uncharacterized protein n=1 Tax=Cucurbitaria berberidis CBS 394.84 TaxID=1168544 RepID=A0A9P4GV27_9PLEO|nr:uncharacterized protein K460DRAFT_273514 [Cucurbitaria berberidis CBS 394.84]KAF1851814.1 hypothetical protein K460DRAFT_273514 [Cucurbitaria berberidis CBS 394.84]
MSTTCLTIHDLLRITYTYETQALEAEARSRSSSLCSTPDTCSHLSGPASPSATFANLETDFTHKYCRKGRR